jgi:two-component system, chemotaxis family, protein-glutamate methylesterase/glutaminase
MPDLEPDQQLDRQPGQARVRVLIVDDSALMRRLLSDLLNSAPDIEIVGTARDGREAVLQAARLKPDVITLDVEMPEVSGLEALPALLAIHEAPVVMVSALTQEGADVTLQALELGAVDFMPKPERNQLAEMRASRDLLVTKVLAAAQSRVRRPKRTAGSSTTSTHRTSSSTKHQTSRPPVRFSAVPAAPILATTLALSPMCIVIGISTGGPQALSQTFPLLVPPLPPILVVQHMPAQFTGIFAERLNRYSTLPVKQAEEGDPVLSDRILIAPGGRHMVVTGHLPHVRIALLDQPPVSGHRPSIDVLFQSAARVYQSAAIGLLMTGMGRDGVEGCKAILGTQGFTLGQDEGTSVVYGMNKAAFLERAVKAQFALDELPHLIQNIATLRAELESAPPLD